MGHKGIISTGEPQSFGKPLLGDPHWNPLWQVAVDLDLPISFHIGSGDMAEGMVKERIKSYGRMATVAELAVDIFLRHGVPLKDPLMSGVPVAYSGVKVVSVARGIGPGSPV